MVADTGLSRTGQCLVLCGIGKSRRSLESYHTFLYNPVSLTVRIHATHGSDHNSRGSFAISWPIRGSNFSLLSVQGRPLALLETLRNSRLGRGVSYVGPMCPHSLGSIQQKFVLRFEILESLLGRRHKVLKLSVTEFSCLRRYTVLDVRKTFKYSAGDL